MNNFADIKGNEGLINNLKNSIDNNKVNHAYIFEGSKGMGKLTVAKAFAKTLNCQKGLNESCNQCVSCSTFDSNNNPDIIYITHQKAGITVEDVRKQILQEVVIKPYNSRYKIFIIPDADKMNVQAQNAFLKSLEEPPEYAKFLLLCENSSKMLVTILSRCVVLKLKPLGTNEIAKYIENKLSIDSDNALLYSIYSQGSIGRAMELATSEKFRDNRNKAIDTVNSLESCDLIGMYKLSDTFKDIEKQDCDEILEDMYLLYRDALVLKTAGNKYIYQKDIEEVIVKIANMSAAALIKICEAINITRNNLNFSNANKQMALESLFFKIKEK